MCIKTEGISYEQLGDKKHGDCDALDSSYMKQAVDRARAVQIKRFNGRNIMYNSQMGGKEIEEFCRLGKEEEKLIERIFARKHITARGYHKILKTARTIADIEGNDKISSANISEAFYYRGIPEVAIH